MFWNNIKQAFKLFDFKTKPCFRDNLIRSSFHFVDYANVRKEVGHRSNLD